MPQRKQERPAPRTKLLDSIYLLLAGLAVFAVIGAVIAFFVAYDGAMWMPHGDRARQLFAAVFGVGFGVAYLYVTYQSRRLQRSFASKPYMKSLSALTTSWWVSLAISLIAFAIGSYALALFVGTPQAANSITVSALVQLLGGTVLVVSGVTLVTVTFKIRRETRLTISLVLFGLLLPAVLIASGIGRVVAGCWQLVH